MEDRSVAVVTFGCPETAAHLRGTLSGIGYRPWSLSPESLRSGRLAHPSLAMIYLIGTRPPAECDVSAGPLPLDGVPSLGLLAGTNSGSWDYAWLEHCWDCARWPCESGELAFRLARLCRSGVAPRPCAPDPALVATLTKLNLIGRSPAFLDVLWRLRRVAQRDVPVLIEGETGTGKELVARAIHYLSPRADGPFIPVNCGALPDNLVENELFGHERGAYTDAKGVAAGAIGEAAGGTLFLDEVETLSPKAQAALLRFLQDNAYRPLGASEMRQADARIVAASNASLCDLCSERRFRSDLFFRLNLLPLVLPSLRDRVDDIEPLARHFAERYCQCYDLPPKTLSPIALRRLHAYRWPGNVRELENLIHREVLMTDGPALNPIPGVTSAPRARATPPSDATLDSSTFGDAKADAIARFERDYLTEIMVKAKGNVTQAARIAGKERRALGKLLKKHAISTNPAP